MAFSFPLTPVLKYREAREDRELKSLQQLQSNGAHLRQQSEQLEAELRRCVDQAATEATAGTSAFHLRCLQERIALLRLTLAEYERLSNENKAQQAEQMTKYQTARSNRQILAELRDNALRQHANESNRREQRRLDDLFGAKVSKG
jgi:flagellar export protein FliJ